MPKVIRNHHDRRDYDYTSACAVQCGYTNKAISETVLTVTLIHELHGPITWYGFSSKCCLPRGVLRNLDNFIRIVVHHLDNSKLEGLINSLIHLRRFDFVLELISVVSFTWQHRKSNVNLEETTWRNGFIERVNRRILMLPRTLTKGMTKAERTAEYRRRILLESDINNSCEEGSWLYPFVKQSPTNMLYRLCQLGDYGLVKKWDPFVIPGMKNVGVRCVLKQICDRDMYTSKLREVVKSIFGLTEREIDSHLGDDSWTLRKVIDIPSDNDFSLYEI